MRAQPPDPASLSPGDLALLGLGAFRLWRLLAVDDLPVLMRARRRVLGPPGRHPLLTEAITCPWCSGAYVALGLSLGAARWSWMRRALVPLAVSAAVGLAATADSALGRAFPEYVDPT